MSSGSSLIPGSERKLNRCCCNLFRMKRVKDSQIGQYLEVRDKQCVHHRGGGGSFTTSPIT